jgi:hypothetical protein
MDKPTITKQKIDLNNLFNKEELTFDIVGRINTKREIMLKMQHSMRQSMPKMHNHQMNLSAVSNKFQAKNGESYEYSDIKPKTTNLPAEINKELMATGILDISWTNVDDLPRAMNFQIKQMGNSVFESFGLKKGTKVNSISCLKKTDLLNTNLELNSVLSFLDKNATKVFEEPLIQLFEQRGMSIKGYQPLIQLYNTNDKAYLVIFEPEGHGIEGKFIYEFERDVSLQLTNTKKITNKL